MKIVNDVLLSELAEHGNLVLIVTHFVKFFISELALGVTPHLQSRHPFLLFCLLALC